MPDKIDTLVSHSEINLLTEKGFVLEKVIGEGSYAKVFRATHVVGETHHNIVACKVIDTSQSPRDYLVKFLPRELDIISRINYPHLVHNYGIFQRRAKYFVVLRFAENGDLLDFLTKNGAIKENQCRFWMRQIISGMVYLHTLNIAHRDLKCENILITQNYNMKITDFGFARYVKQRDRDVLSETYCGSLSYAAPEILKGVPYLPKCADMWSIGIIFYTMLNKALPFNETAVKKLYEKQVTRKWRFRTGVVNDLTNECKKQVTLLMEPDPSSRATAHSVLTGAWMTADPKIAKLSSIEENLLASAADEAKRRMRDDDETTELERMAELRRKSRGKDVLRVIKADDSPTFDTSEAILSPGK